MKYNYYNLAALMTALVFSIFLFRATSELYNFELESRKNLLSDFGSQLTQAAQVIRAYKTAHGTFPSNDEGLSLLRGDWQKSAPFPVIDLVEIQSDPLILYKYPTTRQPLLLGEAGVYSSLFVPFLYENRIGPPPEAFAFSAVNDDLNKDYSIIVDDGVFVWMPEAMQIASEYRRLVRDKHLDQAGAAIALLALLFCLWKANWLSRIATVLLAGLSAAYVTTNGTPTMCYKPLPLISDNRSELLAGQERFIDQYIRNKAISPESAAKLRERMQRDQERIDAFMKPPAEKSTGQR